MSALSSLLHKRFKSPTVRAVLLGLLSALALPPLYILPALFSFAVLMRLLQRTALNSPKQNALKQSLILAAFVFGQNIAGLYWISSAMLLEPERFWWAVPVVSAGLPLLIAVVSALLAFPFFLLFEKIQVKKQKEAPDTQKTKLQFIFLFIFVWLLREWVQTWLFSGFPWNPIAITLTFDAWAAQLASVGGAPLLGAIVLLFFSLPALLFKSSRKEKKITTLLMFFLVLFVVLFGNYRLLTAPLEYESLAPNTTFRLVQPNIPQIDKIRGTNFEENLKTHEQLSQGPLVDPQNKLVIVWPETALLAPLNDSDVLRERLLRKLPPNSTLITGALRFEPPKSYYNSLYVLDNSSSDITTYDKVNLVPFGEYIPPIVQKFSSFPTLTPGVKNQKTLSIDSLPPAVPLICYEIIFPLGKKIPKSSKSWILTISNDGWFGMTSGPHQHFALARLRSIEGGTPLIRVSNPGISGSIDGYGRILSRSSLGKKETLDTSLGVATISRTLYESYPFSTLLVLLSLVFFLSLISKNALNRKKDKI